MENSTNTARRDEHRPVNLVTEDYEYVEAYDSCLAFPPMPDSQDAEILAVWRAACDAIRSYMQGLRDKVATSSVNRGLTQCHHCGAHIRYGALMHHTPSDTYIAVGEVCLENRFERATKEFQRLRKAAQLDRERQRIISLKNEFVEANPDLGFMLNNPAENSWPRDARNDFIEDVARRLRIYGSISDKQIDAVRSSIARTAARREERETEVWLPVPDHGERERIEAVVLNERWDDGQFGPVQKMLLRVETPEGNFKLWGNAPSRIVVTRGDRLQFTCRWKRSDKDDFFGFFKLDSGSRAELVEEGKGS